MRYADAVLLLELVRVRVGTASNPERTLGQPY
jgi:hypothetical protein